MKSETPFSEVLHDCATDAAPCTIIDLSPCYAVALTSAAVPDEWCTFEIPAVDPNSKNRNAQRISIRTYCEKADTYVFGCLDDY